MTLLQKLKRLLGYDSVICVNCVHCRRPVPLEPRRCRVKFSYQGFDWVTGDYKNRNLACEHGNPDGKCMQYRAKN